MYKTSEGKMIECMKGCLINTKEANNMKSLNTIQKGANKEFYQSK